MTVMDVETDNGMHRSDTMQEKLSLVNRFGVTISYSRPSRNEFNDIVLGLAKKHPEIELTEQELLAEANKWELSHGGCIRSYGTAVHELSVRKSMIAILARI